MHRGAWWATVHEDCEELDTTATCERAHVHTHTHTHMYMCVFYFEFYEG